MIFPTVPHDTDTSEYSPVLEFSLTPGALLSASSEPILSHSLDSVVAAVPRWEPSPWGGASEATHPFDLVVRGEAFHVIVEDGQFYLEHPVWSLLGSGPSLVAAEFDLDSESLELADVMRDMPESALSPDARSLRDFVLRLI